MVEIKPISIEIEDFVTDESHVTKQLTFTLPKNSLAAERGLGARRITIDGDQTEYLEVEVGLRYHRVNNLVKASFCYGLFTLPWTTALCGYPPK